jgi:hypothetical protein
VASRQDACRDLDEAGEADKLLAGEIEVVEQRRSVAQIGRDTALGQVLRVAPEITALWERFQAAKQSVRDIAWELSAVGIHRLPKEFCWDGYLESNDTAGAGVKWQEAIARLLRDPDAPLPSE